MIIFFIDIIELDSLYNEILKGRKTKYQLLSILKGANLMKKIKTKCIIVSIVVLVSLFIGCSKYKPPEATLKLSKTITHAEAVSILKDNITIVTAGINAPGQDNLSKVKCTDDGFIFSNFFKAGKLIKSDSISKTYEKVYYDPGLVKYEKFDRIIYPGKKLSDLQCSSDSMAFIFNIFPNPSYTLCMKNEEESFAALLKLMPNASITMWK